MPAKKSTPAPKSVEALKHLDEKRRLLPSAEQQSIMHKEHELLAGNNFLSDDERKFAWEVLIQNRVIPRSPFF